MEYLSDKSFFSSLDKMGIKIVEEFSEQEEGMCEYLVLKHIKSLTTLHQKLMTIGDKSILRLTNNAGREVENLKVEIKKNKRFIEGIKSKKEKSSFDEFLIEEGINALKRAEKCIEYIYRFNYITLIYRSMKRNEICIGDSSSENFRETKEGIEIINFKDFSYNLIEMDLVYYLGKLKRKGIDLSWESFIIEFCKLNGLGRDSEIYVKALISYPYEFMKYLNRYREGKKNWSLKEYEEKILKAIERDGESLI